MKKYCGKCSLVKIDKNFNVVGCGCQPKPLDVAMDVASGAIKHDQDKPDYSLIPTEALDEIAAVWTFGQRKYAAFNWTKGFAWRRPLAASLRHIYAFLRGEDRDPESGLLHLAHAVCCLMMVITFYKTKTGKDNRHATNTAPTKIS